MMRTGSAVLKTCHTDGALFSVSDRIQVTKSSRLLIAELTHDIRGRSLDEVKNGQ